MILKLHPGDTARVRRDLPSGHSGEHWWRVEQPTATGLNIQVDTYVFVVPPHVPIDDDWQNAEAPAARITGKATDVTLTGTHTGVKVDLNGVHVEFVGEIEFAPAADG